MLLRLLLVVIVLLVTSALWPGSVVWALASASVLLLVLRRATGHQRGRGWDGGLVHAPESALDAVTMENL